MLVYGPGKHLTPQFDLLLVSHSQVHNLLISIVYYLPYAYIIYYWALGLYGFWIQVAVAFALSYVYYYLKINSMTNYGKDYFPTPRIFELLVEKYLVIEKQWGIVKNY